MSFQPVDQHSEASSDPAPQVPPHSVATERAVLSAWSLHDRFGKSWKPEPELFHVASHRAIAAAMSEMDPAQRDEASLFACLESAGRMSAAGGSGMVHQIITGAPAYGDPWPHVAKLRELHALRSVMGLVTAAVAEAYEHKDLGATVGKLQDAMRVGSADTQSKAFTEAELMRAVAVGMQEQKDARFCTTGLPSLDNHSGGFQHKQVTVFGAATHWGKSSFAVFVVDRVFDQKKRPLIVSFEDPEEIYARRLMARRAKVNPNALRNGKYVPTDEQWSRVLGVAEKATHVPFFINAIGRTVERASTDIRCVCASEGIDLVIVDYIQAIQCSKRQQDRRNEVAYVARMLTDVIKSSGCAGLMFSQLKRPMKPGERPTKHSLKEAGELENSAENVFIGYIDEDERRVLRTEKVKDGIGGKEYVLGWDDTYCGISGELSVIDEPEPLDESDRWHP